MTATTAPNHITKSKEEEQRRTWILGLHESGGQKPGPGHTKRGLVQRLAFHRDSETQVQVPAGLLTRSGGKASIFLFKISANFFYLRRRRRLLRLGWPQDWNSKGLKDMPTVGRSLTKRGATVTFFFKITKVNHNPRFDPGLVQAHLFFSFSF